MAKLKAIQTPKTKTPKVHICMQPKGKASTSSKKESIPLAAGTENAEDNVEKPYERVTPRDFADSWTQPVTRGKRWWSKKSRKKRKATWKIILAIFAVIVVIVISLIAVGMVLIIQDGNDRRLASKLVTKTAICRLRQKYPECIIEKPENYNKCDAVRCDHIQWTFKGNGSGSSVVDQWSLSRDIFEETIKWKNEFSECGYRKWCIDGSCVDSGISKRRWWPSEAAFQESTNNWVPGKSNCSRGPNEQWYKDIMTWYANRCNKDVCSAGPFVKYGIYLQTRYCDMSQDPVTGIRKRACDGSPWLLYQCGQCENFDPNINATAVFVNSFNATCVKDRHGVATFSKDGCKGLCTDSMGLTSKNVSADGTPCDMGSNSETVCFKGKCVEISDDPIAMRRNR